MLHYILQCRILCPICMVSPVYIWYWKNQIVSCQKSVPFCLSLGEFAIYPRIVCWTETPKDLAEQRVIHMTNLKWEVSDIGSSKRSICEGHNKPTARWLQLSSGCMPETYPSDYERSMTIFPESLGPTCRWFSSDPVALRKCDS